MGIATSLAFLKIGGRGLPIVLVNFLRFTVGSKIYIWKRKEAPIIFFKKPVAVFQKEEIKTEGRELLLKITEKSQLKKIKTEIETKTK